MTASTPEEVATMLAQIDRALALPGVPGQGRLLELGCGDARLGSEIAQRGPFSVAGVDVTSPAIERGRARATEAGVSLDLRLGDVRALPWPDAHFDILVDAHCLHCIVRGDRGRIFAEAHRVLRPGGLLLVMTMVGEPPVDVGGVFDRETRCLVRGGVAVRHFGTPASVRAEVEDGGFEVLAAWRLAAPSSQDNDELVIAARR